MNHAPDDASDLFGYPPPPAKKCAACGLNAEPYYGQFCYRCVATGDAGKMLRHPANNQTDCDKLCGYKPPK